MHVPHTYIKKQWLIHPKSQEIFITTIHVELWPHNGNHITTRKT